MLPLARIKEVIRPFAAILDRQQDLLANGISPIDALVRAFGEQVMTETGMRGIVEGIDGRDMVNRSQLGAFEQQAHFILGAAQLASLVLPVAKAGSALFKGGMRPGASVLRVGSSGAESTTRTVALSPVQQQLLAKLPREGSRIVLPRGEVHLRDLVRLTGATGDEFAMLSMSDAKLIIRGKGPAVPALNVVSAREFARNGWRFSAHTHPSEGLGSLHPSMGDYAVLREFLRYRNQWKSRIVNVEGKTAQFRFTQSPEGLCLD
ncbi:hypothetical protein PLCT2_01943 [Planctomycetaceae bacterium]|nr:hypothetical protein PLCT2_01943 [Planctomycetaceae bacterium]